MKGTGTIADSLGYGPIVIVGRPRSGSRILAQMFLASGIFMGVDLHPASLDSLSWYQQFVVPLMTSRFFPKWEEHLASEDFQAFCAERLRGTWRRYWDDARSGDPWGWKYCETLFVIPVVKKLFPLARFVHIIRDVRDVSLSKRGFFQLTEDQRDPAGWSPADNGERRPSFHEFCLATTFGEAGMRQWRDLELSSPQSLVDNRYLIQAQSWLTCVSQARSYGRGLGDDYFEVKYEDLCRTPIDQAQRLIRWLGLPVSAELEEWSKTVHTKGVGKWQTNRFSIRQAKDFANAVELASPLLKKLNYVV